MEPLFIYPILKEAIPALLFPREEVLTNRPAIEQRSRDIVRALALGNLERQKVRIFFQDLNSVKRVETTVWGVTDQAVILKAGACIPICRIIRVQWV